MPTSRRQALLADLRVRQLMVQASGRRRRGAKVPRPLEPRGPRLRYAAVLKALVAEIIEIIRAIVMPQLAALLQEAANERPVKMDAAADTIDRLVSSMRLQLTRRIPDTRAGAIARQFGEDLDRWNQSEQLRLVRSVLAIDAIPNVNMANQIAAFVRDNMRLISSVHEDLLFEVDGILTGAVRQGLRQEVVAEQIERRFEVTESRAQLIARDQIAKLNGEMTQVRQQALGIDEFIWTTAGDERVRPAHEELDGQRFRWDDPPGEGIPGTPINCRCVAQPVLDEVVAAL